jgi:hypothetical protein
MQSGKLAHNSECAIMEAAMDERLSSGHRLQVKVKHSVLTKLTETGIK